MDVSSLNSPSVECSVQPSNRTDHEVTTSSISRRVGMSIIWKFNQDLIRAGSPPKMILLHVVWADHLCYGDSFEPPYPPHCGKGPYG